MSFAGNVITDLGIIFAHELNIHTRLDKCEKNVL